MLVSQHYHLGRSQGQLDFVDIPIETDLKVFVDPVAIRSLDSPWAHQCVSLLQHFFDHVLDLIRKGDDGAAITLLASLRERNEFHLGYSKGVARGHAIGREFAEKLWKSLSTSRAAGTGLLSDLEDTALLIPGVGHDMISDAVCNIIRGPLISYTHHACDYYGIPMEINVESGPIWNPRDSIWEHSLVSLPVTPHGKLIFVPKMAVRHRLNYRFDQLHRHYLLPVMQQEHLDANSSLVEVLKNKKRRVTKKSLIERHGSDKLAVVDLTVDRPDAFREYKEDLARNPSKPLSPEVLAEAEGVTATDVRDLMRELRAIPTGREHATEYEDKVEQILSTIFYPHLCHPVREDKLHNGRKRVDITYTNEAKSGFFDWLGRRYPCGFMFVECKNYGREVANPEIDQISGRFSPRRGQVGILVCRSIENKDLLLQRCLDTAQDHRGYVLVLDDDDLSVLVDQYMDVPRDQSYGLLRDQFEDMVK